MGSHSSEKRWVTNQRDITGQDSGVGSIASSMADELVRTLLKAEQMYLEMQELYAYAGATIQLLADLLFTEEISARAETVANAGEVAKVQDAFDSVTAGHELYQAANNVVTAQEDRFAQLRRMS